METQSEILHQLKETDNLNDVIEFVVSTAKEFTDGDDASLLLWDEERDILTSIVTEGIDYHEVPPGHGITRRALTSKEIQRVPDVCKDPDYLNVKPDTQSELTVPLIHDGRAIGVLDVQSKEFDNFTESHAEFLKMLVQGITEEVAYHASVAIERAVLFKTIANIASQIGKLDEVEFLRYLTDAIREIFKPKSHCTIWFYSAEEDCLSHKDVGIPDDPFKNCPKLPMETLSGAALRGKRPIAVTDIFADGRHYFKDIARTAGFKSVLSIPILIGERTPDEDKVHERPLGVFNVHTFAPHPFKNLEINLLSAFAGYAAVAIENARNLEQLEAEDRAKSELISVFAHQLKTPLSHFQFYMHRWQKARDLPAKYRTDVATFYPYFERQNRLIDKVTTFAEMKRGEIQPVKANIGLNDVLESVVAVYQFAAEEAQVSLQYRDVSAEIPVYADPDLIACVFDNLIDNAITFTPEGGTVCVNITEGPNTVQIAVSDTGIGISEENQEHIFEDFYSGDPSRGLKGGMGIGLYLVKKIIEKGHDGTITVDSQLGKGSTFTVTLPKGGNYE